MIEPKCLNGKQCTFFSAEDYILPCCWCAMLVANPDISSPEIDVLLVKKVSEVNRIEEITESVEWKEFYKNLYTNPPNLCKDYCSKTYEHKSRESYQY